MPAREDGAVPYNEPEARAVVRHEEGGVVRYAGARTDWAKVNPPPRPPRPNTGGFWCRETKVREYGVRTGPCSRAARTTEHVLQT